MSLHPWIETPTVVLHGYRFYKRCYKQLLLNALPLNTIISSLLFPMPRKLQLNRSRWCHSLCSGNNCNTGGNYGTLPHLYTVLEESCFVLSNLVGHNSSTVHASSKDCILNFEICRPWSAMLCLLSFLGTLIFRVHCRCTLLCRERRGEDGAAEHGCWLTAIWYADVT